MGDVGAGATPASCLAAPSPSRRRSSLTIQSRTAWLRSALSVVRSRSSPSHLKRESGVTCGAVRLPCLSEPLCDSHVSAVSRHAISVVSFSSTTVSRAIRYVISLSSWMRSVRERRAARRSVLSEPLSPPTELTSYVVAVVSTDLISRLRSEPGFAYRASDAFACEGQEARGESRGIARGRAPSRFRPSPPPSPPSSC